MTAELYPMVHVILPATVTQRCLATHEVVEQPERSRIEAMRARTHESIELVEECSASAELCFRQTGSLGC